MLCRTRPHLGMSDALFLYPASARASLWRGYSSQEHPAQFAPTSTQMIKRWTEKSSTHGSGENARESSGATWIICRSLGHAARYNSTSDEHSCLLLGVKAPQNVLWAMTLQHTGSHLSSVPHTVGEDSDLVGGGGGKVRQG